MIYISAIIAIVIIFFPLLVGGKIALIVVVSFYPIASALIFMLWMIIFDKKAGNSFATIFTFFLLFFYIAPILQLAADPLFLINTITAQDWQILLTNGMTLIFLFFYNLFYFRIKNHKMKVFLAVREGNTQAIFYVLAICSIMISGWAVYDIDLLSAAIIDKPENEDLILSLIKNKFIFLIPFLTLAIYLSNDFSRRSFVIITFLLLMVILTKNPLFDRRNSLGPVYLTLTCIAFPYFISTTRKFFLFLFATLVIAFPASSIFTHHDPSDWGELLLSNLIFQEILGHFTDMHYDSWANFVGAVDYAEKIGHHYGWQTLGSLLFFVPRSFWIEKPVSSGQMLGEYLSRNYQLWFENISFPFAAEGYIDFGLPGVILFAIGLSWYSSRIDFIAANSKNVINRISSVYFSIFLLFILRGSLLPAVAYGVSAYLALTVMPFIFSHFLHGRRVINKILAGSPNPHLKKSNNI